VTGLVSRAEARGLLSRTANPTNGRVVDVFLSDDGARLTGKLFLEIEDSLIPMARNLNEAEREKLRALLT
jgi:DNA-binding MarR family transcriptional regulator